MASNLILKIFIIEDQQISNFAVLLKYDFWRQDDMFWSINKKRNFTIIKTDWILFSGFIDFLISNHPIAKILREHIVFKIVPMLNPDGVYLGNYR